MQGVQESVSPAPLRPPQEASSQRSNGSYQRGSSSHLPPSAAPGPGAPTVIPHPAQRGRRFVFLPYLNLRVADESRMVGFANTLGTTSLSIPDIPCFAPTVASQATFTGPGAGYHAREFGMDRESGSWNASRSAFGVLQVQEVHMHLVMAKRRRTNANTPNGAVGRILHLPPLAGCSRSSHQLFSSPTLQRMWTHRIIHAIERPFCICVYFCFCIPIDDGNIGMNTGSYIGSSASFFTGLRTSRDVGEREGKGNFESSLSGSSLESIVLQHSSQPQPPPQVEQSQLQPQPAEDGPLYAYTPAHLPTRAVTTAAAGAGAGCWV